MHAGPSSDSSGPAPSSLLTGLASFWTLNTTEWLDEVGSRTLADHNGVTVAAGKIGNAAVFDGVNQYLSVASSSGLQILTEFTIACWVKLNSLTGGHQKFVSKDDGVGDRDYMLRVVDADVRWDLLGPSGGSGSVVIPAGVPDTGWHFYCAWYKAGEVGLQFDNGTPVTNSPTGTPNATNQPFELGRWGADVHYLAGSIDELGVWQRALTALERAWLYQSGAGRAFPWAGGP